MLIDGAEAFIPGVNWETWRNTFEGISVFFPLSEFVTYTMAFLALWVVLFVYRVVKSWI